MRPPRALVLAFFVACLVGATNIAWTHADAGSSDRTAAFERAPAATVSPAAFVAPVPVRGARPVPLWAALTAVTLLAAAASCEAIRRRPRSRIPAFRFPAPRLRGPPFAICRS